MYPVEPQLTVFYLAPAVLQVGTPLADGLDLRAGEDDAGLVTLLHKIVVEGFGVFGDGLDAFFVHGGHLLL